MHTGSWRRHHGESGLSLIELIVILAILVTLVALLVPSTVQQLTAARWNSSLDEMEALHSALIGDPDLIAQGVRTDFGYLGDMGSLPPTLDELVVQDGQPVYTFDSGNRVGAGWSGPYFTLGPGSDENSHERDAFGNDYLYDDTDYVNDEGQLVDAKVVSLGADGVPGGTGVDEDVTLEILKAETTATVNGYATDATDTPLVNAEVSIHYPEDGVLTLDTTTTDANGFYQFADIPFGMRSVEFEPRLLLVPGSVTAFGGSNQHVRFSVVNYTDSSVTVRFLSATYSTATFYNDARWGAADVYDCAGVPAGSGSTITFPSDETVAASPTAPPTTQVAVASSVVQVPDITVEGAGTQATVELRVFRANGASCNSGSNVNMSGTTFSDVTLLDPGNNIIGQFSFTVP
ncbi:MAG: type II secretion system protein GspG [Actinobacteria bacterium]|nr:type II secretion system protein GspG [Actinomycetota bacterium]